MGHIRRCILSACVFMMAVTAGSVFAESYVPEEYYANYHIADEWETLLELIIDLDASWKVGADIPPSTFRELHEVFDTVFDYFPSDPNSELVYRKCLLVTDELSDEVTRNGYATFKDQCFTPISSLLQKIQNDYTVKPDIVAKPNSGNAPLNVTLDARDSVDPSNDTIPSEFFYWWYRDVNGDDQVIGKGPVVNYTFTDPGNHIVHLTVRSSNNRTEGVFDGEESVSINVAPKSANVIVYANGKRLTVDDIVRLGTQDAQGGILIDATATVPVGARTIVEHAREISSSEQRYSFKQSGEGPPGQFVHIFPGNGVYYITLSLIDNENNRLQERYQLAVSDPVAAIRLRPEEGSTSHTYTFDASASYSLTSRVNKYQWEITDPSGERIDMLETKQLTRKFTTPGTYTVKLTVIDDLGNSSYDIEQFYVSSTPPVPSFTITPSTDLLAPSEFILDASASFDEDVLNGNDVLTYNWSFTPSDNVTVTPRDNEEKEILITFDNPGEYTVRLLVEDAYGEIAEIEKTIEVTSTLRPKVFIEPVVAHWGTEITLTAEANKSVAFYEWNLGNGKTQRSNDPSISHAYTQAGVYTVSLRAVAANGEENTVRQQIFMGQKDMPVVGYSIKGQQNKILQRDDTCTTASGDMVAAYGVERYEPLIIDATTSLNTQGTKTDLSVTIHPLNNEVSAKQTLSHSFLELGCTYVDIYVEDANVGKTSSERIWFNVHNALPLLQNLLLDFPQPGGGGDIGVGTPLETVSERDVFTNSLIDPIVVRVSARGARDPDGFISHFAWYYYESNNPDNIVSLKITPADVPSTSFIIPKPHNPTEYAFAVRMIDNDGGEVTSEAVLGKGPIIFFPPGENNLDIPIVSLKPSVPQVKVGDEITFTTEARILSQKPDFASTRYFKYDFDGDGVYDLTTKQDTVTHRYEKAGEVYPKVAVYYRGRAGVGVSNSIIIQQSLQPILLITHMGNDVLVKNASWGNLEQTIVCMDIRKCRENEAYIIENQDVFHFTYEELGDYFVQFDVIDAFGNEETIRQKITLTEKDDPLGIMTIPEAIEEDGQLTVSVGNSLNNEIMFYIPYTDGSCYMDSDIATDSDRDGDPSNDDDITCNQLVSKTFVPTNKKQTARVRYAYDGSKLSKDIHINFIDYEQVISEEYQAMYKEIDDLLVTFPNNPTNDIENFLVTLLTNLRDGLGERDEMNSVLIQLRDLLAERPDLLSSIQQQRITMIINSLSDSTVKEVFGGTVYDTAKTNILAWFGMDTVQEIQELFRVFEEENGNQETMKAALDEIFQIAGREQQAGVIDAVDMAYIQKNLCDIIVYYDLPSKTCGTRVDIDEDVEVTGEDQVAQGWSTLTRRIVRIVIIVVVILAIVFGVLVVLFAIKARKEQSAYEGDDEEESDAYLDDISIGGSSVNDSPATPDTTTQNQPSSGEGSTNQENKDGGEK